MLHEPAHLGGVPYQPPKMITASAMQPNKMSATSLTMETQRRQAAPVPATVQSQPPPQQQPFFLSLHVPFQGLEG
jgi:hypothetical protein